MNEQVKKIFAENILGAVATVNEDGTPWSTSLHLVTDGEAVYWFSGERAVHSQNIARDPRVSLTMFTPDESQGPTGVFINGTAQQVTGADYDAVVALYAQRAGVFPPAFSGMNAYKLPVGTLDDQKSTGNCWYFYS